MPYVRFSAFLCGMVASWLIQESLWSQESASTPGGSGKVAPVVLEPADAIGQPFPSFKATDIQGHAFDLRRFAAGSPVVIALTSTSCPLCKKYGPTLAELEQTFLPRGVRFVFVNSITSDPLEETLAVQRELGWQGPVLLDRNSELLARFAAESTTEVFLLDQELKLRYRGAVDDQYGLGYTKPKPQETYLKSAIEQLLNHQSVAVARTSAPGCRIKLPGPPNGIEYHRDVARIVQNRCVECHRSGGVAPFPLESPEQVIAHAGMIIEVVQNGTMPPWFAAADTERPHRWINDSALGQDETGVLIRWLESNHEIGDPAVGPVPRVFNSEWMIGQPSLTVELPKRNRVRSSGYMDYIHQRIPLTHDQDQWIEAVEVRPTAPEVVHHVLVYAIPRGSDRLDVDERSHFLAAYAPGNGYQAFGNGFAKKLPADHDLLVQMHYTPNGRATFDQTRIGFRFAASPPRHEIKVYGIANTGIMIPAGAENHQEVAKLRVPRSAYVTAFFPHMHVRGKSFRFEQQTKQGTKPLLDVPRYDFNWQLEYRLLNPELVKAGDQILVTGWFDNSTGNPSNPDPARPVRWGPQTDEEMLIGYIEYYYAE
ncbi:MAG: redoxin family protein [Planctomycetaceae bacterium]|nr:redoxin family protein [Planctomycetaceae bacterium]